MLGMRAARGWSSYAAGAFPTIGSDPTPRLRYYCAVCTCVAKDMGVFVQ